MADTNVDSKYINYGNLKFFWDCAKDYINDNGIINITYSDLKTLRDNSQLVAGQMYRIIDYVTTTVQSETKSANHPFDIIVIALSKNTLDEKASAIAHEGDTYFDGNDLSAWQLWYDLDNDTNKYEWADSTNGKGVIYRMIDEKLNDCPYDFKNILFYNDKLTSDTTSDQYYYTFSYVVSGKLYDGTVEKQVTDCYDNSMGVYASGRRKLLNGNVFGNGGHFDYSCHSNTFGCNCYSNTFGCSCYFNTFGCNCHFNTFGYDCSSNTFDNYCTSNKFGDNCSSNTFGDACSSNTFGNYCYSNTFGDYCSSNKFGDNCELNTFGDNCELNTFGDACNCTTFDNYCNSNIFNRHCNSNTFGNNCELNTFGNYCYYNTFGNYCTSNIFSNNCSSNKFGDNCSSNIFGVNCHSNTFGNNYSYKYIDYEKTSITLNDEYYDDGSGKLVPIKHPDLSTQPSILPYKFMEQYVYEQLIPVKTGDRVVSCDFMVEHPTILSAGVFGANSFKNVDIIATKSDAMLLNTESELVGYINVKYTDGSQLLLSNGHGYGYGYEDNNAEPSGLIDFGVSPDGTVYVYDPNTEVLSLYKSGKITQDSIPQSLPKKNIILGEKVTSIGESAFYYCSGLTSMTIGNSVTSIGKSAFSYCSGLTSVTIPNSVTSIGDYAFYRCYDLTSVTIPNSVTSIGAQAFEYCYGLTSVTIPNSVTSIGNYAFRNCTGLTEMRVDANNSKYDSREGCNAIIKTSSNTLLYGCQTTVIPNSVTSIGDYAFQECTGLTSVTIPNSVTSIGDYAFQECTGLTSVTIPNSVTSIGKNAFYYCSSLTSVTSNAITPPSVFTNTFFKVNNSIPVYVPVESIDAYKAASGWNKFTNIQAI